MALTLFDTSTLVASLFPAHPGHDWALQQRQKAAGLAISAHSLAETYKVLTAHPQLRIAPVLAQATLEAITQQVQVIELGQQDYLAVLERCAEQGLSGSVIFDGLIAQAALKVEASALATLNPKDFKRLGKDVAALLVHP